MSLETEATRTFNIKITGKIDKWYIEKLKWFIQERYDSENELEIEIEEVEE